MKDTIGTERKKTKTNKKHVGHYTVMMLVDKHFSF